MLAQGVYRSVVFGSEKTHLYSYHPDYFGKIEMMTMWGFPAVTKNWNFAAYENKMVELIAFSNADEVALYVNGKLVEKKQVSQERPMPNSVRFAVKFESGTVEAVSYKNGKEISRDKLVTSGSAEKIRIAPEKTELLANGHDVSYVNIEVLDQNGNLVTDSEVELEAELNCDGEVAFLAGFGSANPITPEDYTDNQTSAFHGRALAIVRSGYKAGELKLTIKAKDDGIKSADCKLICK